MKRLGLLTTSIMAALTAVGCSTTATQENLNETRDELMEKSQVSLEQAKPEKKVMVFDERPYVDRSPVNYDPKARKVVDVIAQESRLVDVLTNTAGALGYSVSFTESVDPNKRITLTLKDVDAMNGLRKAAFMAGYAIVPDHKNKDITVSETANWVFRLPPGIFDQTENSFDVGSSSDSESEGSGSTIDSKFNVSGEGSSQDREEFIQSIQDFVADDPRDAEVSVNWTTGILSVSSNINALHRVKAFVDETVRQALTQVEIQAAILQVRLQDSQQYGIDWKDVLGRNADNPLWTGTDGETRYEEMFRPLISNTSGFPDGGLTATITKNSVTSVIRALAEKNKITYLTQPTLMTRNHSPATLFNGKQVPYLGKVETTSTGTNVSVSAESQYATDGVNLSMIPHVLDNENVSLKMLPVLNTVGEFSTFAFGNEEQGGVRLEVPESFQRQMHIDVVTKHNQTLILGGNRTNSASHSRNGIPGTVNNSVLSKLVGGVDNLDEQEELVILINTRVIQAPQYNALISENL